ncbi:MAG: hypothetical protein IT452_10875 [Planctomycetia bacterium]|nr:hypothetical protein [Planctomycetia bacterium]
MNAEGAYLFRHALLRDAAYQLQMPADRARLHAVAVQALEATCGGRPPEMPPLDAADAQAFRPHPSDPWARELARQAAMAGADPGVPPGVVTLYLRRSATLADRGRQPEAALEAWEAFTERTTGADRAEGELNAGQAATAMGRNPHAEKLFLSAARTFRELGDARREAVVTGNLASLYMDTGRLARALEIHRSLGNRAFEGSVLGGLALMRVRQHRQPEARSLWADAMSCLRAVGRPDIRADLEASMRGTCREAGVPALDAPGA